MNKSPNQIAKQFGCSPAQVKAQFAKNAAQLKDCAIRAGSGLYRGYSRAEWMELATTAENKSK